MLETILLLEIEVLDKVKMSVCLIEVKLDVACLSLKTQQLFF